MALSVKWGALSTPTPGHPESLNNSVQLQSRCVSREGSEPKPEYTLTLTHTHTPSSRWEEPGLALARDEGASVAPRIRAEEGGAHTQLLG